MLYFFLSVVFNRVALGSVFLVVVLFSPVSIIPQILRTLLLSEGQTGDAWEPSKT